MAGERKEIGELRFAGKRWTVRLRASTGRRTFALETCRDPNRRDLAEARARFVARLLEAFDGAGELGSDDAEKLLGMACTDGEDMLPAIHTIAGRLVGGTLGSPELGPTFEMVAREWLTGKLRERYPDHVRPVSERYAQETLRRLKGLFQVLGSKPIAGLTRADCDAAMRQLPDGKALGRETRRQYAVGINRVLNLAELAGYVPRNPLPRGWLPRSGSDKRFPILYPAEDRAQLGDVRTPLWRRLLCGFLHREGVRRGEALALRWTALDLERETITLDENKTNHSRYWRLDAGTAEALRRWRQLRGEVPEKALVFVDESDAEIDPDHLSTIVRRDLERAGVKRADLTSSGPNKGRFGVHSYRRSFVTRNLALGKNEDWVRQRTGHKSDELLRYRQGAKAFAELELGELDALHEAIPELRVLPHSSPHGGDVGGGSRDLPESDPAENTRIGVNAAPEPGAGGLGVPGSNPGAPTISLLLGEVAVLHRLDAIDHLTGQIAAGAQPAEARLGLAQLEVHVDAVAAGGLEAPALLAFAALVDAHHERVRHVLEQAADTVADVLRVDAAATAAPGLGEDRDQVALPEQVRELGQHRAVVRGAAGAVDGHRLAQVRHQLEQRAALEVLRGRHVPGKQAVVAKIVERRAQRPVDEERVDHRQVVRADQDRTLAAGDLPEAPPELGHVLHAIAAHDPQVEDGRGAHAGEGEPTQEPLQAERGDLARRGLHGRVT